MTRTTCYTTLSCAALLVALGAYGCGSSSTINPGTGGTTGGQGQGGRTMGSLGGTTGGGLGGTTGGVDAGPNTCVNNAMCAAGFTCDATCMVGNAVGTRTCACGANGRLVCPAGNANCLVVDAGPPPPMPDAGFNACMNATPCTMGFTCSLACNVNGNPGARACTCGNNRTLNCGNANTCMVFDAGPPPPRPDAGFNMCMNNTPCTTGFTCNAVCNVNGNPGTRPCTCGGNNTLNCPGGNANCTVLDAGAPLDAARPDVVAPTDAPVDAPPG